MKTETDLKYKYTHITKGSIKKPPKNINTLKSNLNVLDISNDEVLYFKSEFFLIKTTDYSCSAYVRV